MQVVRMQLKGPAAVHRDVTVTMINEVTRQEISTQPYSDGSVVLRNVPPGSWRVKAKHPNLVADIVDQPIRVLPGIETRVTLPIPRDLFTDTPIRDIPDADLGPVRDSAGKVADIAERQGRKRGGQPIFADDWNELSGAVADVARATDELTRRVAPLGHDHPELVAKLDELQRNLSKFYDVFGASLAQLQRQIQQLALERRIDDLVTRVPNISPAIRGELAGIVKGLDDVRVDSPFVYSKAVRSAGEKLVERIESVLPADQPEIRDTAEVADLIAHAKNMSAAASTHSFEDEIKTHTKIDRQSSRGAFGAALKSKGL